MITIDTRPYKKSFFPERKSPAPLFCPNPDCPHHSHVPKGRWFTFRGTRANSRHGMVHFYLCNTCERSFSSSTFLISYYEKVDLDYDEILRHARQDISLSDWASLVNTTPGTLKLRLCKIGWILLKELSDLCLPAAGELLFCLHGLVQRGVGGYRVLRDMILLAITLLSILKNGHKNLSRSRPFLSSFADEKKNLFFQLRLICCEWRYLLNNYGVYYHTKYQWE